MCLLWLTSWFCSVSHWNCEVQNGQTSVSKTSYLLCSHIADSSLRMPQTSALIDKINNNHAFTYLNSPHSPKRENIVNNCEAKLSLCGFLGVVVRANRMSLTRYKRPWGWSLLVLFGNLRLLTSITIYWPRCYIASHYPDLRGIVFGMVLWNFPTAKPLKCACFTPYPQRQAGRQTASLALQRLLSFSNCN